MKSIPSQKKKWKVGIDSSDIRRTRNMSFNENGIAKSAQQPIVLYTNTEDADLGFIKAILNDYIVTSGNVFALNTGTGAMTEQTTTSMPDISGTASDAVYYLGELCVSSGLLSSTDTVGGYNGSSWTSRVTGLTNSTAHPLCVFKNRNTLCIGNGNVIWQTAAGAYSQDSSNTLTIPAEYTVTWMRWRNGYLYIGTRNTIGESARLFVWNGTGTSTGVGWSANCDWIYSGIEFQSSMVVLTSTGQLLRFNGGGFDELAHLPVYETTLSWSKNAVAYSTRGRCENRGMVAYGDVLYLNIDGMVQGDPDRQYLHDQPSGLWVYDPEVGLYHMAGYAYTKFNTLTITAVNSSILTVGTHLCETGDQIRASSVGNITGLTTNRDYYVINVDSTHMSLALSAADAQEGRNITISGTPSGDTLAANRTNHGAVSTLTPGAIGLITNTNTHSQFFGSDILFSGTAQDQTNTQVKTLMSLGTGRNVSHMITEPIEAGGVKDAFQKIYTECKNLVLDTQSIVLKYRTRDKFGLPTPHSYSSSGLATWVDSSSFTINATVRDFKSVAVGDEVEIIEGAGAGFTAHITTINNNTSTYTVTIDEVIPNIVAGYTSEVVVDYWVKLGTISTTTDTIIDSYAELPIGEKGSWVEFKVELRGRELSINNMSVVNATDKEHK